MAYTQSQTNLSVNLSSGIMSNGSTGIIIVAMMMISLPVPFCLQKLRVITVHTQENRKQYSYLPEIANF